VDRRCWVRVRVVDLVQAQGRPTFRCGEWASYSVIAGQCHHRLRRGHLPAASRSGVRARVRRRAPRCWSPRSATRWPLAWTPSGLFSPTGTCAASSCGPDWSTDAAAIPTSADRRTNECDAIRILLLPQLINHYRPLPERQISTVRGCAARKIWWRRDPPAQ
jgi:hypothetical protein